MIRLWISRARERPGRHDAQMSHADTRARRRDIVSRCRPGCLLVQYQARSLVSYW